MGYIAALFIGISLGLIGGGGSILTVPLLVYMFGVSPIVATSYSLFVVGSTSLVGSLSSYRKGWVDIKTAFIFGLPSIITVFIARKLIIPLIPPIINIGSFTVSFSILTMILFAVLMLAASLFMIKDSTGKIENIQNSKGPFSLTLYGIGTGLITGFLGAGGGFLLIPALILALHFPMKKAIGTSLLIITLNGLIGFIADTGHYTINWRLLISISAIAIGGVLIGGMLGKKIEGQKLKTGFGWFILLTGVYIIIREILFQ